MIKVGIVDDEILARNIIEDYCAKIDNLKLVISTGNPIEFINFLQQNELDLIFLDIEMPELSGMEILRSMVNSPKVILTTAYSEYAVESYNYDVVDYLLKPIKLSRFLKAIHKVSHTLTASTKTVDTHKALQLKQDGMPITIAFTSILYIQSFGNYLKVFTDERMYLITETLTNMTNKLPDYFQRTHKSYIANLCRVNKRKSKHLWIEDKVVPISTTFKILVQEKLKSLK
ncbi:MULTISPECIES: LytTR family DNA-binding domain-containing protein [unclassified Allomuricauda]|uniref:LytR/AlgR family response regulator transcription factor n=1 Tax=unclassified Allomuricauda TaxID=2615049 RepID=UPI00273ECB60|nr:MULTISPECIES: LytTR family DNA-binding domain-containing protein [unclassified Allomuricauda]